VTTKGLAALALTVEALVRMPAVTAQETTRTVTVAANKTWQTTGIVLSNQNFVDIQYVSGNGGFRKTEPSRVRGDPPPQSLVRPASRVGTHLEERSLLGSGPR